MNVTSEIISTVAKAMNQSGEQDFPTKTVSIACGIAVAAIGAVGLYKRFGQSSTKPRTFDSLPQEFLLKLFDELDPQSSARLLLTNKKMFELSNNNQLWKKMLKRDFGKTLAPEVSLENSKKVYLSKCKQIAKEGSPGLPFLRNDSLSLKIVSYLFSESFIGSLSPKQLAKVLNLSIEHNCLPLIRAIIEHNNFNLIPLELIGQNYCYAAQYGCLEGMKLIRTTYGRFKEIAPIGNFGISSALACAVQAHSLDAMEEIIKNCEQFNMIPPNDDGSGMKKVCWVAIKSKFLDGLKLIREKYDHFNEITAMGEFGIGYLFCSALEMGYEEAMNFLITCPQYKEVITAHVLFFS